MTIGLRLNNQMWGFYPNYMADRTNTSLNNAATWLAFGFVLDSAKTLSKVRIYSTQTGGSPVAADYRCELYSSTTANAPRPNSSVETGTTPASVGNGVWVEWTGFTTALSANTMYWIVFKNVNAVPATNKFDVFAHLGAGSQLRAGGGSINNGWGWSTRLSTNSGSSWGTPSGTLPHVGIRLEFSDGSFEGLPLGGLGTVQVYSSREAGAYFVSPDVALNVKGVGMGFKKASTPTGLPRYRIYLGATPVLQGTTGTPSAVAQIDTTNYYWPLFFTDVLTIPPSSIVRVVLSETTQSDTSTNRYDLVKWDIENDANTKALLGSIQSTLSTDGGATFAETDTDVVPFGLFLTTQAGITAGGSEFSSPKNLPLSRYRRGHMNRV